MKYFWGANIGGEKGYPFYHVCFLFSTEDCGLLKQFQLMNSHSSLTWEDVVSKCTEIHQSVHTALLCHVLRHSLKMHNFHLIK